MSGINNANSTAAESFKDPDHLDYQKHRALGNIPSHVPSNLDAQRSWAWSCEHPHHPFPKQNVQNYMESTLAAYGAAGRQKGAPQTYGVSFIESDLVRHQYGTSAPHINTGPPRLTTEQREQVREYRKTIAYSPGVSAPETLEPWPMCQCVEYEILPRIVSESAHLLNNGVTIYTLAVSKDGTQRAFCRNCQQFAWYLANRHLGLTIIDVATNQLYESDKTKELKRVAVQNQDPGPAIGLQ